MFTDVKIGDKVKTFEGVEGVVSKVSTSYFIAQFHEHTKYYTFKGEEHKMWEEDMQEQKDKRLSFITIQAENVPDPETPDL